MCFFFRVLDKMGNNLAAIAPNIILPVEKYLEGHVFETQSLGSTRFMKVVRAKNAPNVSIVAKVNHTSRHYRVASFMLLE